MSFSSLKHWCDDSFHQLTHWRAWMSARLELIILVAHGGVRSQTEVEAPARV